jgi:ankyrin repeat protein
MSEHTPSPLPEAASMDWMRKRAKQRLRELRQLVPTAKLADAQFEIAKRYGFRSWRGLKAHIDSLGVEGELFAAAADGNLLRLRALLDENPALMDAREEPFGGTLLHVASRSGQTAAVELLLERGLDVNARDVGDNASPLHWAAGAGHLEVVQMLTDAHGDVVGEGDDHELQVIGWATCFTLVDERRHAIADFLVSRGARHHIFSAIATGQEDGVRRIVVEDPPTLNQRMSRHENGRLRLHFAVNSNRPELVTRLIDADPRAARSSGVLHLLAKRGDARGLEWLLERGFDPNARWSHWDAEVAPLHLGAAHGHVDAVKLLLKAGADPTIRDSKHDGDAIGWAEHGRVPPAPESQEIVELLETHLGARQQKSG